MQDFSRGGYDPRHSEKEEQRRRYYEYVKRRQLIKRAAVVGALILVVLVIIISVNQCDNGANMPSSLETTAVNAASDKEFPNSNIKDIFFVGKRNFALQGIYLFVYISDFSHVF